MTEETEETEISQSDEVAALLSEAAELHAAVYRITDDEDADWASWYAKWLLEFSEFPDIVGEDIPVAHLVYELVRLDRDFVELESDEAWELFYAERLIDAFEGIDLEDDQSEDDEGDEYLDADDDDVEEIVDAEFETQ